MATFTERQEQVATWDGSPGLWLDYVKRVRLQYERTPHRKRKLLGAELASRLTGRAWDVTSADIDHERLQQRDGPASSNSWNRDFVRHPSLIVVNVWRTFSYASEGDLDHR